MKHSTESFLWDTVYCEDDELNLETNHNGQTGGVSSSVY